MAKIIIAANWKMNPARKKPAKLLFDSVLKGIKESSKAEVILFPPFVYLLKKNAKVRLGAQNCSWQDFGALTGEISPLMLKDMGCQYVIVGHSERRKYFAETDSVVNEKLKAALRCNLIPILCIDKISQIKAGMEGVSGKDIKKIIVAYEPVWAIGTGKACGYEDAKKFNLSMKQLLGKKHCTLYGGSVNSANALGFIKESLFQGLLIGGASLNAKEFLKIVKLFV